MNLLAILFPLMAVCQIQFLGSTLSRCNPDNSNSITQLKYSQLNNSMTIRFEKTGWVDIYMFTNTTANGKLGALDFAEANTTVTIKLSLDNIPAFKKNGLTTIQVVYHPDSMDEDDVYFCTKCLMDVPYIPLSAEQALANKLVPKLTLKNGCNLSDKLLGPDAPSRNFAALWLRAVFHDTGLYDPKAINRYVAGSLPYFLNETDNFGLNNTLASDNIPKKFFNFSDIDMIILGGQLTVTHCGGPNIPYQSGRLDTKKPVSPVDRLPHDEKDSFATMKKKLYRLGLNDNDIVTLVAGSHSMGISPHATNSSFAAFDKTPGVFDNDIFKQLLNGKCILNIDCGIAKDPIMRPIVQRYADNQDLFFKNYAKAYPKLAKISHRDLHKAVLLRIPLHENLIEEGTI
ncbi:heme peroxidase [Globomyces pollinis-pini]|nr:heme peroxidase [Globomyces pollinis-pini]